MTKTTKKVRVEEIKATVFHVRWGRGAREVASVMVAAKDVEDAVDIFKTYGKRRWPDPKGRAAVQILSCSRITAFAGTILVDLERAEFVVPVKAKVDR